MIGETDENNVSNADNVKVRSSMAFFETLWKDMYVLTHKIVL